MSNFVALSSENKYECWKCPKMLRIRVCTNGKNYGKQYVHCDGCQQFCWGEHLKVCGEHENLTLCKLNRTKPSNKKNPRRLFFSCKHNSIPNYPCCFAWADDEEMPKEEETGLFYKTVLVFPKRFEFFKFLSFLKNSYEVFMTCKEQDMKDMLFARHFEVSVSDVALFDCLIVHESDILFNTEFREYSKESKSFQISNYVLIGSCGSGVTSNFGKIFVVDKYCKGDRGFLNYQGKFIFRKEKWKEHDVPQKYSLDTVKPKTICSLNFLNANIIDSAFKDYLFDMETYDFFQVCDQYKLGNAYCFRFVTDLLSSSLEVSLMDYLRTCIENMEENLSSMKLSKDLNKSARRKEIFIAFFKEFKSAISEYNLSNCEKLYEKLRKLIRYLSVFDYRCVIELVDSELHLKKKDLELLTNSPSITFDNNEADPNYETNDDQDSFSNEFRKVYEKFHEDYQKNVLKLEEEINEEIHQSFKDIKELHVSLIGSESPAKKVKLK